MSLKEWCYLTGAKVINHGNVKLIPIRQATDQLWDLFDYVVVSVVAGVVVLTERESFSEMVRKMRSGHVDDQVNLSVEEVEVLKKAYPDLASADRRTDLYLLRPNVPWKPWYDCCFGSVIEAHSVDEARRMASEIAGDEGADVWLDENKTGCVLLRCFGDARVVIRDFMGA